jgi:uncharacterized protein YrrD
MELNEGTQVYSVGGKEVGKINRFVLNPVSKRVSHIIVEKGLLFPEDKVVPIDWITSATSDRVVLSREIGEIQDLPPFEEVYYVRLDEAERQRYPFPPLGYTPSYYWYPPFGAPAYNYMLYPPDQVAETERNIPERSVPLKEGANVISAEGSHVGDVERLMVDPESNRATHFLITKGLLLKERKLVPVGWVDRITEDKVQLAVGEKTVDRLPDYPSV